MSEPHILVYQTRYFWRVLVKDTDTGSTGLNDWERLQTSVVANITASAGANGRVSPAGIAYVVMGGSLSYIITPSTGYVVDTVTVDGVAKGAITSYTFTGISAGAHTINATFKTSGPDWTRPESISAKLMVHYLGRGINLGQTFESTQNPRDFNSVRQCVDDFIAAGFTSIRLPVNWGSRSDGSGNVGIDGNGNPTNGDLQALKQLVEYVTKTVNPQRQQQGKQPVLLMIDTHHENWMMYDLLGSSNYSNNLNRLKNIWTGICTIFRDAPDTVLFELFNEPHEAMNGIDAAATVRDMNNSMYGVIRNFTSGGKKPHQYRKLVIGGVNYNSSYGLFSTYSSASSLPGGSNDGYLIGTFHFYKEYNPANIAQAEFDKVVNQFVNTCGVPVVMGEFGSDHRNGVGQDDIDYYRNIGNWAVARGFAIMVWDDNGWFQVYNRGSRQWNALKDAALGDRSVPPKP
jgi:endoglucanase